MANRHDWIKGIVAVELENLCPALDDSEQEWQKYKALLTGIEASVSASRDKVREHDLPDHLGSRVMVHAQGAV